MSTKLAQHIDQIKRIHFIGIGGIGMSALARHFLSEKKIVSGSDRAASIVTEALEKAGVTFFSEQTAENISPDIELVIYTEAMSQDHPELVEARAKNIPTINYFDALGLAMNPYHLIAVAGTHGKTTTTAMLTDIFEAGEKDPTAIIGSLRAKTGINYRAGKSKYALVEACEYKRDFLSLQPDVLVITNLELEHVDCYKNLQEVQDAFRQLISQVSEDGAVIANLTDPNILPVIEDCDRRVVDYMKWFNPQLQLRQPGVHNRLNAAAALAAAVQEKIDDGIAQEAIRSFAGTWRRFEYKGDVQGADLYDDYAHHPTEIIATVSAARELYPDKKIITVFKPHTFARTAEFFSEFAKSFSGVDQALFLPIYAARAEEKGEVSSRELAVKTMDFVSHAQYFEAHEQVAAYVRAHATPGTVILIMGAGDVTEVTKLLLS